MDTKMNIKDLHRNFPMIKTIQKKMDEKEEITIGQKKAFPRQVEKSSLLQLHVNMIQSLTDENHELLLQLEELKRENRDFKN